MQAIVIAIMVLALSAGEADARRRGHHRQYAPVYVVPAPSPRATEGMGFDDPQPLRSRSAERSERRSRGADEPVPPGWQMRPPDPNWNGRRYVSPDGAAWYAVYDSPADHEPASAHLKTVAFADGEEITYLRGERGWLAVSGLKGDRIFYRKAVLMCGGRTWRHIAFEYPVDAKRRMDALVDRASSALDVASDGCEAVSSSR